jgi:uncharacterized membrane protein YdbT with pleckstrin-like domain
VIFIVDSMLPLLGAIVLMVVAFSVSTIGSLFAWLGLICLLIAIGEELKAGARSLTTEFALTDKRIIAKTGLLQRHSLEIVLPKVESIRVIQPLIGRLLDYGTIVVVGTGGTAERFRFISHPHILRKRVNASLGGG